jgi:hypothetical protein
MAIAPDSQNTLLSFLYHVSYNRSVNRVFHGSPNDVMDDFNLSAPVRAILQQIGQLTGPITADQEKVRADLIKQLMSLLADEFAKTQSLVDW